MAPAVMRDIEEIIDTNYELLSKLENKSILITGATGMIGRYLTTLLAENLRRSKGLGHLIINVRNQQKAERMFDEYLTMDNIRIVVSDISDLQDVDQPIDYIIHAASPTQPQDFLERPVDIIHANVFATDNLLKLARKNTAHFCLLSTLEIYGKIEAASYPVFVTEEDFGALDSISLRSAYPESKRVAENLCVAYRKQFNIPTSIIRLAPVISPLIEQDDKRVYAQFIHDAVANQDITIYSDAASKERSYTYISDAVIGILTVLLGATDENYVFNLANNGNMASIQELAEVVLANAQSKSKLQILERESDSNTSSATGLIALNSEKLTALGWRPQVSLAECVKRTLISESEAANAI